MAEMGTREAVSLELDLLMRSSQASNSLASVPLYNIGLNLDPSYSNVKGV